MDKHKKRISSTSKSKLSKAQYVTVCWRFQKNGDNGQKNTYARGQDGAGLCYVQSAINIVLRAQRLGIPSHYPVGAYKEYHTVRINFISSQDVRAVLRKAAKEVHNITSPSELARFTCHSIRVGACVLLHSAGKDFEYIKFCLRWKSDAFRMYLRNVTALAVQHAAVLDADQPQQAEESEEESQNPSPPKPTKPKKGIRRLKNFLARTRWSRRLRRRN